MTGLGFETPWEQVEQKIDREMGRFEAKLDGMLAELVSEQRVQRLAILQVNNRVAKLEQKLDQAREAQTLSRDDVRQALAEAIQDVMNTRQVLLVLGVPSGVLGLVLLLLQLLGQS